MTTKATTATEMRRCIGSKTFSIEAHEAPVGDFPVQPSQKDGLGRMCREHWTEYTRALRKAALARRNADREARFNPGSARARAARKARAVSAKPAIRPVPKPAKKPKGGRRQLTTNETKMLAAGVHAAIKDLKKREAAAVVETADGGTIDDAAFGRERETELGRAALGPSEETTIA